MLTGTGVRGHTQAGVKLARPPRTSPFRITSAVGADAIATRGRERNAGESG
jgi:hypothetical protein